MRLRIPAVLSLTALLFAAAGAASRPVSADAEAKIRPALRQAMREASGRGAALRVWVYFKDTDGAPGAATAAALAEAEAGFQARSLARRAKARPGARLVDELDLPVAPAFRARARALSSGIRAESRWLNAVSVEAAPGQIPALARLDCVARLDLVPGFQPEDISSRNPGKLLRTPNLSAPGNDCHSLLHRGSEIRRELHVGDPTLHAFFGLCSETRFEFCIDVFYLRN